MELALSFSHADALRIEKYAAQKSMSVFDFAKRAVMKSIDDEDARAKANAEYLAMLDAGFHQMKAGKGVSFTDEEWEKFVDGDP